MENIEDDLLSNENFRSSGYQRSRLRYWKADQPRRYSRSDFGDGAWCFSRAGKLHYGGELYEHDWHDARLGWKNLHFTSSYSQVHNNNNNNI